MPRQTTAAVATLGIDIGKNVFHLIGLNERSAVVLRHDDLVSRSSLLLEFCDAFSDGDEHCPSARRCCRAVTL